jgi:hypothetical protein
MTGGAITPKRQRFRVAMPGYASCRRRFVTQIIGAILQTNIKTNKR